MTMWTRSSCRAPWGLVVLTLLTPLCLCSLPVHQEQDGPTVTTEYGVLRGVQHTDDLGRVYETYLGIPFATPPVGDLRWTRPIPPQPWEVVRDASQYGAICIQVTSSFNTSEDCLFLNVFVPEGVQHHQSSPLPVIIWIHGGAYMMGGSVYYPGQDLAMFGHVVVVTVNYRLGVLGFMTTGDQNSLGNFGLWDIRASLQWVQSNIAQFGGDPNKVTVLGQSAGASIASHLMIAPPTRGLFHRAISMSGTSTAYFGTTSVELIHNVTKTLARNMLCPFGDNDKMVECLRKKDANRLFTLSLGSPALFNDVLPTWVPVVDGEFLPQHPRQSWEEGASDGLEYIVGSTYDDGANFLYLDIGGRGIKFNIAAHPTLLDKVIMFALSPYPDPEMRYNAIVDQYPDYNSSDVDIRTHAVAKMCTDWWFQSPPHLEAGYHSRSSPAYVYQFQWRPSFLQYAAQWITGAHSDDNYYVFGEHFSLDFRLEHLDNPHFTLEDKTISHQTMAYYTNFAYTGNPNEGPHLVPTFWEPYNADDPRQLRHTFTPHMTQVSGEELDSAYYWNVVFPNLDEGKDYTHKCMDQDRPQEICANAVSLWTQLDSLLDIAEGIDEDLHTPLLYVLKTVLDDTLKYYNSHRVNRNGGQEVLQQPQGE